MKLEKIKFKDHQDWLELRKMGIGGSDAAVLAGDNKYRTPFTLWMEKTGRLDNKEENEAMRQGTDLEQYVAERFTEKTGKRVHKVNFILRNPDYPFAIANVDRMVTGENAGLECKTMNPMRFQTLEDGDFPVEYYAQCQHYMAVTGADKWYLAILVLGKDFVIHEIERDEEYIKDLMDFEESFWDGNVLADEPPAVDGEEPTSKALPLLYPNTRGSEKLDLINHNAKISKYLRLVNRQKELDKEIKELKNELEQDLGEFEIGESDKYRITWKPQISKRFQYNDFIKDHPEFDYAPYYKETKSRVFRVKEF